MNANSSHGTAVITGASGGIGAEYADRFARRDFDLLLIARDEARLKEVAQRIETATSRNVETLPMDLTNKTDLHRLEARLKTDESLTVLVNNAGFGGADGLLESNNDQLENMIDLNVTVLTRLTSAILPHLVKNKSGAIINIASAVALQPEALNGTYSGTKAYVVNFTQALFDELKETGVRVQVVLPGATRTRFWDRAGLSTDELPTGIVMDAGDCVDAALVGYDRCELVTIPALVDIKLWKTFDEARQAMYGLLAKSHSAPRYRIHAQL